MDRLAQSLRRLRSLLLRRGSTRQDAEDLVQEAFVRMQDYCRRGGEVRVPEAFLARTVLRLALNARRDSRQHLYVRQAVEDLELVDAAATPDEVFAAEQCLERMRDRLDSVSLRTREIFFMHRLDGLSYAEIADRMRISVSAIEKHIATALATLTDEMQRE